MAGWVVGMGLWAAGCAGCQVVEANVRFAEVAAERDYAAREAWEAEWNRDAEVPDDDGPTEAGIPEPPSAGVSFHA